MRIDDVVETDSTQHNTPFSPIAYIGLPSVAVDDGLVHC